MMLARKCSFITDCFKRKRLRSAILFILFINLMVFNLVIYFVVIGPLMSAWKYVTMSGSGLANVKDWSSLNDFISKKAFLKTIITSGKDGGFATLHDQLLGRLYMVSHNVKNDAAVSKGFDLRPDSVSFFGVDVSDALEATYIYRRILGRNDFHVPKLVVDIGANDGLMSSNSFNFIQWGWSAILVEPQQKMLEMAKKNTKLFRDPYNDGKQRVEYVPAVIGDTDGMVKMAVAGDITDMENYIVTNHRSRKNSVPTVDVPCMTVQTFAKKHNVPKRFGLLSIDAEGVGDKILHQFIDADFRPAYVIYEPLHNKEYHLDTIEYMKKHDYKFLTKRGWNQIYELQNN